MGQCAHIEYSCALSSLLPVCARPQAVNVQFMQSNSIRVLQFGIQGNKEPFVDIPEDVREWALDVRDPFLSSAAESSIAARTSERSLLVLVFFALWAASICWGGADRLPVNCWVCELVAFCVPRFRFVPSIAHAGHSGCIASVARRAEPPHIDPLQQGSLRGVLPCRLRLVSASLCLSAFFLSTVLFRALEVGKP